MAGAVGKIDQAGELLHPEIGVRLEPEAVDVLRIFEPKEGVVDRRGEGFGDQADDSRRLQRLRDRPHDGKARHRRRVEIAARVVVQLAPPGDAGEVGRGERQVGERVGDVGGKEVFQQVVAIRRVESRAAGGGGGEGVGDATGFAAETVAGGVGVMNRHGVHLLLDRF